MRQVTVELNDKEMAELEALARQRCVKPADLLKTAAFQGLANTDGPAVSKESAFDSIAMENMAREDRRRARLAILMRSSGIFEGDPGKPKDGLIYQKELREEWQ